MVGNFIKASPAVEFFWYIKAAIIKIFEE